MTPADMAARKEMREKIAAKMQERAVFSESGLALRCRLFVPEVKSGEKYPLVLFLHGTGERGHDNINQVVNNGGAFYWADDAVQQETPCYIAAPQCPDDLTWSDDGVQEMLMRLVDSLRETEKIDSMRLYVTGLSMGGMGTWKIVAKNPHTFAAAMPVCGAATDETASNIGETPLWAFHAADDTVVPAAGELQRKGPGAMPALYGSRLSVMAALRAGARDVRYTEYPEGMIPEKIGFAHACWEEVYMDDVARRWMFSQNRLDIYGKKCLTPGVWEISDSVNDSFYIIEGRDRALVIDTGMARGDIIKCVESVTRLPYSLALTHGHGDHSMHCAEFSEIYIDSRDNDMLFGTRFEGQKTPDEKSLRELCDGYEFDLGGGVVIKTVALPGHTRGSVVFVDAAHKCVFTGDAVGSGCGVWMQVPTGLPLSEYAVSCKDAAATLEKLGVDDFGWTFLGGHAAQRFQSSVCGYNPVCIGLIKDMAVLCEKLVSGEIEGTSEGIEERAMRFGDVRTARYQTAEMIYRVDQLK